MITQPCPRCEAARVKAEVAESIVDDAVEEKEQEG